MVPMMIYITTAGIPMESLSPGVIPQIQPRDGSTVIHPYVQVSMQACHYTADPDKRWEY